MKAVTCRLVRFILAGCFLPGLGVRSPAQNPPVALPSAELAMPTTVHPGDHWMKASVPIQTGATYRWAIAPGTTTGRITAGQGTGVIQFAASTAPGTFQVQVEVRNRAGDSVTASRAVTVAAGTWLVESGGMAMTRANATATLLPSGRVLVAGGGTDGSARPSARAEIYDPATGNWVSTGDLATRRTGHTATLLPNGKVLVVGGNRSSGGVNGCVLEAEIYEPATGVWTPAGQLHHERACHTAVLLSNGTVLVAGGYDGTSYYSPGDPVASAEIYDPATGTWTLTGSLATARWTHTATRLGDGRVLVAGGNAAPRTSQAAALASAEIYDPVTGIWTPTGALGAARFFHAATRLPNGTVLATGGQGEDPASAEIYDPVAGAWTPAARLGASKSMHTATLLPNGAVLVTGGAMSTSQPSLTQAEVYHPASDTWTAAASMRTGRYSHTETLLADGTVLVSGGCVPYGQPTASAERYDSAVDAWSAASEAGTARYLHTTTLLADGTVLVAGGWVASGQYTLRAEVYDPAPRAWKRVGDVGAARYMHTATLLPSGQVLVAGGGGPDYPYSLGSVELYDPSTESWRATSRMTEERYQHTATVLADGRVLVAGGYRMYDPRPTSAEIYDPATEVWSATGSLGAPRVGHVAARLSDGKVLVAGGQDPASWTPVSSAEIYDPSTGTWTATGSMGAALRRGTATPLLDGTVLVAGSYVTNYGVVLARAEIYHANTGSWTLAGSERLGHVCSVESATLLHDGRVLVEGGSDTSGDTVAAIYDPATGTWTDGASPGVPRDYNSAVCLHDGTVLLGFGRGGDVVTEIYMPVGLVPAAVAPAITTQPASQVATAGQSVTFAVEATGTPPLSFQWEKNQLVLADGGNVSGATTAILTLSPASASDAGAYHCVVSNPAGSAVSETATLTVNKTAAGVTLTDLAAIYDGTPKEATATTVPAGLPVVLTYDEAPSAPAAAGTYRVVAVVSDPNYEGTTSGTLVIARREVTVTLENLNATYDGTPKVVTTSTVPGGLPVALTYAGGVNPPVNAGAYAVVATVNDPNHTGTASAVLIVSQAAAEVLLDHLAQVFDGSPKRVRASTVPAGLAVRVSYNGDVMAPTAAGGYAVRATVSDPNYVGATTGSLVISPATATLALANLQQAYDGSSRTVTVSTRPADLAVRLTYGGGTVAPVYPGSYEIAATITDPDYAGTVTGTLSITITALVRHAPSINGEVDGSVQVLLAENVSLNGSAGIFGDLLLPGTPAVRLNGHPTYAGTRDGPGGAEPGSYAVTLNGNALLRHVVRRIDPLTLPVVDAPPAPSGLRDVAINHAGQGAGDFATVRNLTLNGGAGQLAVPPGTYGQLTANGGSGFILGVAGATGPSVYNLRGLTLNGSSQLQLTGPVILTLANAVTINGTFGSPAHSDWLVLRIHSGGLTLNGGDVRFHGTVIAPGGTVVINGNSTLSGIVAADRLTINGGALLKDPDQ